MANAKRASMREGPLAALFRKTAEDGAPDAEPGAKKTAAEKPAGEKAAARGKRSARDSAATAAASATPAPDAGTPAPKARRASHPAVAEPQPPLELDERPPVPSPQERLRHAFSADIPHNLMDRAAPPAPRLPRGPPTRLRTSTPAATGSATHLPPRARSAPR